MTDALRAWLWPVAALFVLLAALVGVALGAPVGAPGVPGVSGVPERAYADNSGSVGVQDVPVAKYDDHTVVPKGDGVPFVVTCSMATQSLAFHFEPDRVDAEGLTDLVTDGPVDLRPNAAGTGLEGSVTVHYNGTVTFVATLNKTEDDGTPLTAESGEYVVDTIDWSAPIPDLNDEELELEGATMRYRFSVTDYVLARTEHTAASGLKDVTVFYWDGVTQFPEEDLQGITDFEGLQQKFGDVLGVVWRRQVAEGVRVYTQQVDIDISRTGVGYFLLCIDQVGNVGLSLLFYREKSADEAVYFTWKGVTYCVSDLLTQAHTTLDDQAARASYRSELIRDLSDACSAVTLHFYLSKDEYDDAERWDALCQLSLALNNLHNANEALQVTVRNGDLVNCVATVQNGAAATYLNAFRKGDTLELQLIWSLYDVDRAPAGALEAAHITACKRLYKLECTLLWNGVPTAPDTPIPLHVEGDFGSGTLGVAKSDASGVSGAGAQTGERWLEVNLEGGEVQLWLALGTDSVLVWALVGGIGGGVLLAVVGVCVWLAVRRKRQASAPSTHPSAPSTGEGSDAPTGDGAAECTGDKEAAEDKAAGQPNGAARKGVAKRGKKR